MRRVSLTSATVCIGGGGCQVCLFPLFCSCIVLRCSQKVELNAKMLQFNVTIVIQLLHLA